MNNIEILPTIKQLLLPDSLKRPCLMLILPQMSHQEASKGNSLFKNALSFGCIEIQCTYTTSVQKQVMAWMILHHPEEFEIFINSASQARSILDYPVRNASKRGNAGVCMARTAVSWNDQVSAVLEQRGKNTPLFHPNFSLLIETKSLYLPH